MLKDIIWFGVKLTHIWEVWFDLMCTSGDLYPKVKG